MKLSESLFTRVDHYDEYLPADPELPSWRDVLLMAVVAAGLVVMAFDLIVRASDPYDINKPRQRIAPVGGITGHGERVSPTRLLNQTWSPKAQGVVTVGAVRDHSALASPTSFPASFAGSIATRNQIEQEVISPVPAGGTERAVPVLVQTAPEQSGAEKVAR